MRKEKLQIKENGLLWIALAGILWSMQGVLGKINTWNPVCVAGFRAIAASMVIGTCRRNFLPAKGKKNWLAAFFVLMTGVLFLLANHLTTAANAVAIQYTMPIFVILISCITSKKRPQSRDIFCLIVMMIGIVICFYSSFGKGGMLGNTLALLSAFTYAMVYLLAKDKECDSLSYSYQGSLMSIALVAVSCLDQNFSFSASNFITAMLMGILVGLGYVCFARGFREKVNPTQAAVISYLEPVLNPIWVTIFVGEKIGTLSFVGILLVLVTAVFYSVSESKKPKSEK